MGNGGVKDNLFFRRGEGFKDQDILRLVLLFDFKCEYFSLNIGVLLEKMKLEWLLKYYFKFDFCV